MSELKFQPDDMERLGEQIKKDVLENYRRSAIRTGSGTMLESIEQADIDSQDGVREFSTTVELADLTRPARENERAGVPVREYAGYVFEGRAGMMKEGSEGFRFMSDDQWHSRKHIAPSRRDLNILELDDQQQAGLGNMVGEMAADACDRAMGDELNG